MNKFSVFLVLAFLVTFTSLVIAAPNGAGTVTPGNTSTATSNSPQSHNAAAGNVTELTVSGESVTQTWQGYYGNVSGVITLENAAGSVLYNWSASSPQGEVFASIGNSVNWNSVDCYNVTGNVTNLEGNYSIGPTDVDGVNETFSNSTAHDAFAVGSVSFAADACFATFVYDNTTTGVNNHFEEVLLTDGARPIFASLLEQNVAGFDNNPHDFEMLVLEDGHLGDVSTTPYFFYIELG